jgi:SOS-response transcriptional repressor LexA
MNVHQRIRDGRKKLNLSVDEFAKRLGVSRHTVQLWEKDDAEGGTAPSRRRQPLVANLLGLTVAELISDDSNVVQLERNFGVVPLISWVRAGDWMEAADPLQPGEAERWLPCPVNHGDKAFALRVRGDSMTASYGRTYPEGSIIFVDPQKRSPVNGDRIIAKLAGSDEVTFKVYKEEDGRKWLQPLNPSHQPIREPFKVLGTVIGKWEDE